MRIRKAEPRDAESILSMHAASIKELCSEYYRPEQISGWLAALKPEGYIQAMTLFEFFVAEEESQIMGFCILDWGKRELNALYVAPWAGRRGIGKSLLLVAENSARMCCLSELLLNATLNAVSFYESAGYKRIETSVNRLPSGIELPCWRMMKKLSGDDKAV